MTAVGFLDMYSDRYFDSYGVPYYGFDAAEGDASSVEVSGQSFSVETTSSLMTAEVG